MNTVYTASNITMVAGTASPALVLNSGSGVGVTLSSSDSDVLIVAHGNVAKTSGSTNSAYNMDILVSGGNLGTGLEDDGDPEGDTDDANTKVVADITDGIGYGVYVPFFFIAYDTAPGSTTPTYNFIRNGTPSIVYTFQYVGVTIFEVFT